MAGPGDGTDAPKGASLPEDVQDEIGRRLRATLRTDQEKPAFLGDEAVPAAFEGVIRRLQGRDRSAQTGLDAVRNALGLNEAENREPRRPRTDDPAAE